MLSLFLVPEHAHAAGTIPGFLNIAPSYLFRDPRYWVFLCAYAAITAFLVTVILRFARRRDDRAAFALQNVSFVGSIIFANGLLYQIFHHVEHVTQIFQWWYLGLSLPSSRGIVFFFDVEWNHFIFDSGYFLLMTLAALLFARKWWLSGRKMDLFGASLLGFGIGVQGWHALEHLVRIVRHVDTSCDPCRGVVDSLTGVKLIPLHFWYNTFTLTLPLLAFFWFRMDRAIVLAVRELFVPLRRVKKKTGAVTA